jgi:hypothetical protein
MAFEVPELSRGLRLHCCVEKQNITDHYDTECVTTNRNNSFRIHNNSVAAYIVCYLHILSYNATEIYVSYRVVTHSNRLPLYKPLQVALLVFQTYFLIVEYDQL